MSRLSDLQRLADATLVAELPAALKDAIDAALQAGAGRKAILALVRKNAGGAPLVLLASEAYLESRLPARR